MLLPIWMQLSEEGLLPPAPVQGQAGAPKKGPKPTVRIPGPGDKNLRSMSNTSSIFRSAMVDLSESGAPAPGEDRL